MNALRFWLGFIGWSLATLLEIPLQALKRLLEGGQTTALADDVHDVFEEDSDGRG